MWNKEESLYEIRGEVILDQFQRAIWYRTFSSKYLLSVKDEIEILVKKDKVYKLPYKLDSTASWKILIESTLPKIHVEDSLRDLC
jgi:hypothetical protein